MGLKQEAEELMERASLIEMDDFISNPDRRSEAGFAVDYVGSAGNTSVSGWATSNDYVLYDPVIVFKNEEWTEDARDVIKDIQAEDDPALESTLRQLMDIYAYLADPDVDWM